MKLPVKKQVMEQGLESLGVHPTSLEGSAPETSWLEVYSDDEGRESGIWECTPGKYRMERESDEFCYILQGHWKLISDDGEVSEVKAGDAIFLRNGWGGTSHIIETVRKVFMIG
ncbi:MAG: DUF861 domain-containing protein [Anaerolineae bacterium]|nr:DUF861 domain-containing protein [Anaerolineae bacterium]